MFFRFCGALRAVAFQQRAQVLAGKTAGHGSHLLRGTFGYDLAAGTAALRAKIDDMVGTLDEIQIMLDDDDRIAHVHQLLQHLDQAVHVCNVQACGGFVQNIHRFAGAAAGKLVGQLYALCLTGKDLDGNDVDNSLFSKNAVTVVNFWFSGCKPCVAELGELNALNETLKKQGGAVVGINVDTLDGNADAISTAKNLLESKGASYQNIYFPSDSAAGDFAGDIMAFPTTYVIDRSGAIVGEAMLGGIDNEDNMAALQKLIDQALANDSAK